MRIAIAGCAGRMGRMLLKTVLTDPETTLAAGSVTPDAAERETDLGLLAGLAPVGRVPVTDIAGLFTDADVVIEFTTPALTVALAREAAARKIPLVSGTTGLSNAERTELTAAAESVAILHSGNMSLGVAVLAALVEQAARALDPSYDIEIVEMHHRQKVDAPSGTALLLGDAAAHGRNIRPEDGSIRARDGHTGPRPTGPIGFASLRGGTVIGDHRVIFAGGDERIELAHVAEDRQIFASGAVKAAKWLTSKAPALYTMRDVVGF